MRGSIQVINGNGYSSQVLILFRLFSNLRTGMEVPYSFVIYSAAGAIGLATLENTMYFLSFYICS